MSVTSPAQQITRAGELASTFGSADNFTGRARVDPLFPPDENLNASLAYVTFDPGARSAWHTHPAGQRLVVFERGRPASDVDVYKRASLGADDTFDGPAIVEERETTVVIRPGWHVEVAGDGSLIATRTGGAR